MEPNTSLKIGATRLISRKHAFRTLDGKSLRRRQVLGIISGVGIAGCSGALGGGSADDSEAKARSDVIVGPEGRLTFEPAEIAISRGDSVTWYFDSPSHNVSGRPVDSSMVHLPESAEPFSSYAADASSGAVMDAQETFVHTFQVAGTYEYVCIPHQSSGMAGQVHVEG